MKTRCFNILFLSRIERTKGVYESIEALRIIRQEFHGARLVVAGDGPELPRAKQYVAGKCIEGVEFVGYLSGDAKRKAFESADAYIFPTTYGEGMPTCVLEAMAHGLPVLTRPVGGLRDFFQHGRMGFLTGSTDSAVFASYLARLISQPYLRARMGAYNRQYAMEHFSASRVAGRIREIYRKVASGAGSH